MLCEVSTVHPGVEKTPRHKDTRVYRHAITGMRLANDTSMRRGPLNSSLLLPVLRGFHGWRGFKPSTQAIDAKVWSSYSKTRSFDD